MTKTPQHADLRTLGAVPDAYAEMEGEAGQPIPEHALASLAGLAPSGDYRAEPAPRSDHMAEGNALYGSDLGYRERRRRAKLRRRARDRDARAKLGLSACVFQNLANYRDPFWRGMGWWSTAEGRREWLAADRQRKRARRAAKAALREAPTAREAGEMLIRVLSEGQPFRARKEIRRAIRGLRA